MAVRQVLERRVDGTGQARLRELFGGLIDVVAESPLIRRLLVVEAASGLQLITFPAGWSRGLQL